MQCLWIGHATYAITIHPSQSLQWLRPLYCYAWCRLIQAQKQWIPYLPITLGFGMEEPFPQKWGQYPNTELLQACCAVVCLRACLHSCKCSGIWLERFLILWNQNRLISLLHLKYMLLHPEFVSRYALLDDLKMKTLGISSLIVLK